MLASEHLSMIRALSKQITKLDQLVLMKEAVIQSQGKTIIKIHADNEALRLEVQRANVYVAVEEALKHE